MTRADDLFVLHASATVRSVVARGHAHVCTLGGNHKGHQGAIYVSQQCLLITANTL